MEIAARVDWLRVTVPTKVENATTLLDPLDCTMIESEALPYPWYNETAGIRGGGRVDWNTDLPDQGVLYTFTARALEAQQARGIQATDLINRFLLVTPVNFTRLDLAIDLINGDANPEDLLNDFRTGNLKTHVRKATSVQGYRNSGVKDGETYYFGARTGERMLRAYDKGAEQGRGQDWIRLEMELKQRQANRAARALLTADVGMVAASEMREFILFRVPWYQAILAACRAGDWSADVIGRKKTEAETWLYTVAAPKFFEALESGEGLAWDMLASFMKSDQGHYLDQLNRHILSQKMDNTDT